MNKRLVYGGAAVALVAVIAVGLMRHKASQATEIASAVPPNQPPQQPWQQFTQPPTLPVNGPLDAYNAPSVIIQYRPVETVSNPSTSAGLSGCGCGSASHLQDSVNNIIDEYNSLLGGLGQRYVNAIVDALGPATADDLRISYGTVWGPIGNA